MRLCPEMSSWMRLGQWRQDTFSQPALAWPGSTSANPLSKPSAHQCRPPSGKPKDVVVNGHFRQEEEREGGQVPAQNAHMALHSVCSSGPGLAPTVCRVVLWAELWSKKDPTLLLNLRPVASFSKPQLSCLEKWR